MFSEVMVSNENLMYPLVSRELFVNLRKCISQFFKCFLESIMLMDLVNNPSLCLSLSFSLASFSGSHCVWQK